MLFFKKRKTISQENNTGNITINTNTDTLTNIASDLGYIKAKVDNVDETLKKHDKRITKLEKYILKQKNSV